MSKKRASFEQKCAAGNVVEPLGFEGRPSGDGIANSVGFYAASFPFFVSKTWLGRKNRA